MNRKGLDTRFWSHVEKGDSCWTWTGARCSSGYGQLRVEGRLVSSHRMAWMLSVGTIPGGLCVLHHCDNRSCVRPDHLFLGTRDDNTKDMDAKGRRRSPRGASHGRQTKPERTARGEQNGRAILDSQRVIQIRRRARGGETVASMARELGMSEGALRHIVKGRHWKHIEDGEVRAAPVQGALGFEEVA